MLIYMLVLLFCVILYHILVMSFMLNFTFINDFQMRVIGVRRDYVLFIIEWRCLQHFLKVLVVLIIHRWRIHWIIIVVHAIKARVVIGRRVLLVIKHLNKNLRNNVVYSFRIGDIIFLQSISQLVFQNRGLLLWIVH